MSIDRQTLKSWAALTRFVSAAVEVPTAWLLPRGAWPAIARMAATVSLGLQPRATRARVEKVKAVLGRGLQDPRRVVLEATALGIENRMMVFREFRPVPGRSRIRLSGTELLDRALAEGRGTILWMSPLTFMPLVSKVALHQAGYHITHVGTPGHHPIMRAAERRYITERLEQHDESIAHLPHILERLSAHGLVTVMMGTSTRNPGVPFLGGTIRIGTGIPSLALRAQCPLLTMFLDRPRAGAFDVIIEGPIDPGPARTPRLRAQSMLRCALRRLEGHVRRTPSLLRDYAAVDTQANAHAAGEDQADDPSALAAR